MEGGGGRAGKGAGDSPYPLACFRRRCIEIVVSFDRQTVS